MSTSRYDVFLKAVECGSLSAAAEQLGYTQSAVSQIISALERELGVTLLTRGKYGVRLTTDGAILRPCMEAIRRAETAMQDRLLDIKGVVSGRTRVGTLTSVSCHILPPVIRRFQKKYPQITLELRQGDYRQIEGWILDGTVDMGFLRLPLSAKLDIIPFLEDEMVVVLPENHPWVREKRIPADKLTGVPFVLQEEGYNEDLKRYFRENGAAPRIDLRISDDYTIMSFVEQGIGVSILPETVLRRSPYRVVSRPLEPSHRRSIGIACLDRAGLSTASRLFMEEALAL